MVSGGSLGREYTKLRTSNTISNRGDGIRLAAFPLLAASLTDDPAQVAALGVPTRQESPA